MTGDGGGGELFGLFIPSYSGPGLAFTKMILALNIVYVDTGDFSRI